MKSALELIQDQSQYVGICGQGFGDHPDFAKWLVVQGVTSIILHVDGLLGKMNGTVYGEQVKMICFSCLENIGR